MFKHLKIKDYDFKLILLILLVNLIGILAIGSSNTSQQHTQILGSIFGMFIMVVVSLFDYKIILKFYWLWYFIEIGLLALVKLFGDSANGAARWFVIAGIRFQPSETAKIILIIFFAQFIMKYKEKINTFTFIISYAVLCGIPLYLIVSQPDLSTTLVITSILIILIFAAGLDWKIIIGAVLVAVPSFIVFLSIILKEDQKLISFYQRKRVLSFFYPEKYVDDAYQQVNSVIAIGSGQLLGKGLFNNNVDSLKSGSYIIEPTTDFVFAVIGEEMGFIGALITILLLFLIVLECFLVARYTTDKAGRMIAIGMGSLIGIQLFFNVGVNTFILPNTGLTLPFVSYGLTSLLSLYIGMGFVLNVRLRSKPATREKKELDF